MTMEKIHTDKAPAAIGPYSQAIVHAGVLYTSGLLLSRYGRLCKV